MYNSEGENVGQSWDYKIIIIRLYCVFQVTHCIGLRLFDNGKGDNECGETLLASR